ncbi:MAG: ACP S-malonyltransferase [Chlamydiales bacterium]|nr:ACP S-malonyltransferase [Chlamydiales bacterium]
MDKKFAFLFPGQGAQYPGMGKEFCDAFSTAKEVFEEADEHLKTPFSKLIFEGPSTELTLTKNSQIAIYITSVAILRTLQQQFPGWIPSVCAGLSLGEYTALTASNRIGFQECLELVKWRATWMHEACEENLGSMQVVLGLDLPQVEAALKTLSSEERVWIANINCPGQIVIAGDLAGLSSASSALKLQGAKRVLPLDVSGAFHSGLMQSAKEKLEPKIRSVDLKNSEIGLVMNVPGGFVHDLESIKGYLIQQVTSPVRWEQGIRSIAEKGVDLYLEIGPGKTLAGMNKRIGIREPTYSLETLADLEKLYEYVMGESCIC